jgi:hypothetical protein
MGSSVPHTAPTKNHREDAQEIAAANEFHQTANLKRRLQEGASKAGGWAIRGWGWFTLRGLRNLKNVRFKSGWSGDEEFLMFMRRLGRWSLGGKKRIKIFERAKKISKNCYVKKVYKPLRKRLTQIWSLNWRLAAINTGCSINFSPFFVRDLRK